MNIKVTLTFDDYKNAQWLSMRPRPVYKYAGIIILILLVICFLFSVYDSVLERDFDRGRLIFWGCIAYLLFFYFYLYPSKYKRLYKQHKLLKEPIDFEVHEAGIKFKSPSIDANLGWDHFIKWKEGKKTFILYQNDALMNIFPKRYFNNEDDINSFRKLISYNIETQIK
jgi:hypothetical protein